MPATTGTRDASSPDGPPARGKGWRPRPRKVERLYPSWTAPARDSFHRCQSSFEKAGGSTEGSLELWTEAVTEMPPASGGGLPTSVWICLLLQVLGNSGPCGRQNVWLGGCKPREVSMPSEVSITTKEQGRGQSLGFLKNEKDNALLSATEESRKRWNFSSQYIGL